MKQLPDVSILPSSLCPLKGMFWTPHKTTEIDWNKLPKVFFNCPFSYCIYTSSHDSYNSCDRVLNLFYDIPFWNGFLTFLQLSYMLPLARLIFQVSHHYFHLQRDQTFHNVCTDLHVIILWCLSIIHAYNQLC